MRCPDCGGENPPNATFCGLCHASFDKPASRPAEPLQPPGSLQPLEALGGATPAKRHVSLMPVLVVAAVLVLAGIVLLAIVFFSSKTRTYDDPDTGLTFSYPKSWLDADSRASQLAGAGFSRQEMMDFVLVDRETRNVVEVKNLGATDTAGQTIDWETLKETYVRNAEADFEEQGITFKFEDATIGGSSALITSTSEKVGGKTATTRSALIYRENVLVKVTYISFDEPAEVDAQWKKIFDSMTFSFS
ncbi:MAG: zinc ribbon domain-containing protein [Actinobacteria bacterium]|nr:zinc ribbon domain-containing protein [Actinomycetota bacterium]MBU1942644.1 zinc ribbon domain-containing protein [Actinomycetota bacterium]MBU2686862.1 zinc ribbon domain-containing protein [Actinomycetota bacterium]